MIEALLQAERLLVHGQVDQAEQIYANAFAQDPNNAIALVGLARVALERGDEQLAYSRAREALQLDPQNAAAQRLEARLAEVFAARAEPTPAPAPEPTPDATAEARPSERAFLTRNPSMAEHAAAEEQRQPPPEPQPPEQPPPDKPDTPNPAQQKPPLWRRILGE